MKLARIALAALFVYLVVPAPVDAHSGVQSYIYMSVFDGEVEGRVEYPIADLAEVLGIGLPDTAATIDGLSEPDRLAIVDYTRDHLEVGDDDGLWPLRFDGTVSYLDTGSVGGYVIVPFGVAEQFDEVPRRWTVTYDGVIEANPERDALFLVENDWRTATFDNEGEHLLGFSVGNETQLIELDSVSAAESLREVARRGTVSVDRSAMVLAAVVAVLAAALSATPRRNVAQSDGRGVPAWRLTLIDVATRIGILIGGLSVSLWAIGLTGADIGSRLAMATGALGVLAASATWWARHSAARAAALGVGVLSGVVIGAAFVDQQLDRSAPIRSLIAFQLGAAAVVVAVAVLLLPLLFILRRGGSTRIGAIVAGVIAVAGLVWLIESSFGLTFRLRTAELQIADVVTSPLVVGIVTAVVAVVVLTRGSKRPSEPPLIHDGSQTDPSEPIEVR